MKPMLKTILVSFAVLSVAGCASSDSDAPDSASSAPDTTDTAHSGTSSREWVPLFNGTDLQGWTPKFRGHPLGENVRDTFVVENGLLRVQYDGYESFDDLFGHLFFAEPFSHYDLRVVYRFVGDQCPGGAGWARRNNGVMLHGQSAESMGLGQSFPVSIEAQMLGEREDGPERSNGNVCTPGTHVHMNGELDKRHCIESSSATNRGDEWVEFVVEVRGHDSIRHIVDGEVVLEYERPTLDEGDDDAARLIAAGAPVALGSGTISIQAESHPIDFKTIEIRVLED